MARNPWMIYRVTVNATSWAYFGERFEDAAVAFVTAGLNGVAAQIKITAQDIRKPNEKKSFTWDLDTNSETKGKNA